MLCREYILIIYLNNKKLFYVQKIIDQLSENNITCNIIILFDYSHEYKYIKSFVFNINIYLTFTGNR